MAVQFSLAEVAAISGIGQVIRIAELSSFHDFVADPNQFRQFSCLIQFTRSQTRTERRRRHGLFATRESRRFRDHSTVNTRRKRDHN